MEPLSEGKIGEPPYAEPLREETGGETQHHVHPLYIWQLMTGPILVLLLLLLVLNFAYANQDMQRMIPWLFPFDMLLLEIALVILILVPSYIWIWLGYINFVYIIKKDELVIRKGIIRRRNNAIPYNKIRNVQRLQSLLERIFGLCTISIETAGVSLAYPDSSIPGMANSRELPEAILKKMRTGSDAPRTIQLVTAFKYTQHGSAKEIFSEPLVYCESKSTNALVDGKSKIEFVGSLENCVLKIKELISAYYSVKNRKVSL